MHKPARHQGVLRRFLMTVPLPLHGKVLSFSMIGKLCGDIAAYALGAERLGT